MDDFSFKIPGKTLGPVLISIVAIGLLYGFIIGDSKKAYTFLESTITFVTKPIFNYYTERTQNAMKTVIDEALPKSEEVKDN